MSLGADAAKMAVEIANDDSHGYDQSSRWGPDYDCSSLVISIYSLLGVDLHCTYTGDMRADFLRNGFSDVADLVNVKTGKGLLPGDVLLNPDHAAMYIGNRKIVAARINEKGTTTGGQTGDQTGREICEQSYYGPWKNVLRYNAAPYDGELSGYPWVQYGSFGVNVYAAQAALMYFGYLSKSDLDGICGKRTQAAIKRFQEDSGLEVDGVAGDKTLWKLFNKDVV